MFLRKIGLASCLVLTAGCSVQPSASTPTSSTSQVATVPSRNDGQASTPSNGPASGQAGNPGSGIQAVVSKNNTTNGPEHHSVIRECGGAKMTLECTAKSETCDASALSIESSTSPRRAVAKPSGMEKYTPTGLACATSKQGGHVFIVQYGELPFGCKFCEWFHLYDDSGKPLTASSPPIIQLKGRDPTQAQAPNNAEFDSLAKKLQLDDPEIQYVN
jgi:hypothetical protein